jgi:hypothetical protein
MGMRRCAQKTAGLLALAAAAALAPVANAQKSFWGDPAECHDPVIQEGCERCCDDWHGVVQPGVAPPSWVGQDWSGGNCTGCKELPKDARACGDCFPATRGWYNHEEFNGYPGQPAKPANCKPCSNCTIHVMELYRQNIQLMQPGGKEKPCNCTGSEPHPAVGPCFPNDSCDCMCNYYNQLKNYCALDPDPMNFIGPCAFDKQFNMTMAKPFTGECDAHGYYSIVACGKTAPPPLPPNANVQQLVSATVTVVPTAARGVAATPSTGGGEDGFCWCVHPASGIQNGSSATAGMDKTKPQCIDTVREDCYLLGEKECDSIGAGFCAFTCYAWGCQCHPITPVA